MTSTISASDLLKFFPSLVFTVFVGAVGDVLDDLTQSYLELMTVVQHCPNLVAFIVPNRFRSVGLLTCAASGFRLHLHCLLDRGGRDDISNLVPETLDAPSSGCSVDNPDNSLIESIWLFESLFQRHAPDFGSHHFMCKL